METSRSLTRARDAAASGAWPAAVAAFDETPSAQLTSGDLLSYADAAWWTGELPRSIELRQQAYARLSEGQDEAAAAGVAARLAIEHFIRGEAAVGGGWLARARRHLDGQPEGPGSAFVLVIESSVARFSGDPETSVTLAREASAVATRVHDPNLLAMAIHAEGLATIDTGRIAEGTALLDEAMTSVLSGELSPYFTGVVFCNVIEACLRQVDLGRAGEWAAAAKTWCESLPDGALFLGLCAVNRAELARMRGDWDEALQEAERAAEGMTEPEIVGNALVELGEVRRRRGDLGGAAEAFERAAMMGAAVQPGFALVRLAQGNAAAASAALRSVDDTGLPPPRRAVFLQAKAEVALAQGELQEAQAAVSALQALSDAFSAPALEAIAAFVGGSVALAEEDATGAAVLLAASTERWQQLKIPYEAARARLARGRALRELQDEEGASLEFRAALEVLEHLGADHEAARARRLLGDEPPPVSGLTPRELEVLRLVASGKTNRDIAVELVLSEHTVGRHLQNIYAKLDVSSRAAATAFAFEHHLI